jgi:hypothetical protein
MSTEQPPATWPGPVGRPARPHWWSIQPPPPSSPISARRAYLEVLGVFAAFFAGGIVAGAETLARTYPAPSGSWSVFGPATITDLAMARLAVAVTVLLSARRGITPRSLGFGLTRNADGSPAGWPAFRMAIWALAALITGSLITTHLTSSHLTEPAHLNAPYLLYSTAASLAAGVVEETVVLAFVVTTLRQAGRPLAEIVIVAVLLRCSYHDYYGPGVVGIAVWATVFLWLFLRTGSIVPLIIVHFFWDATIFWSQQYKSVAGAADLIVLVLTLAAVVSWLFDFFGGQGRPPAGGGTQAPTYTAWPYIQDG